MVKTLEQVSEEIGEKIGIVKQLTPENGYYVASFFGKAYEKVDSKIRMRFGFKGRNQPTSFGTFKTAKGYNSKYKNTHNYANHYGEYIASIILKQLGKKVCKTDLAEANFVHPFTKERIKIMGVLSHHQTSLNESVILSESVCEKYRSKMKDGEEEEYRKFFPKGNSQSEKNYANIEVILNSALDFLTENGQEEKFPDIRKKIINTCIFDMKFANRDRHDENLGFKINQDNNDISFYHLFDNEQILGMQEDQKDVKRYLKSPKAYEKFKEEKLTSYIGVPGSHCRVNFKVLLQYLLDNYYDETMEAIDDIGQYKLSHLRELMEHCQGLSDEHKEFAEKIFLDREREMNEFIAEYNKRLKDQSEEQFSY